MAKQYNLARMTTATTGTDTITLGSAVAGFLSFSSAGVSNGETITYSIKDGSNSEIGRGVYTASGTTLTRTVLRSTNSNNAISLSGTAEVAITVAAEDIIEPPSSSTDNAAVRYDGTSGRIAQNSALIIADTTGALSRSGGGGIPVQGTNTNDSASSGDVGEFVSSTVAAGSAVSLTTLTTANITSISLTAGDWDVSGQVVFTYSSATPTSIIANINTTSATLGSVEPASPYSSLSLTFSAGTTQFQGLPTGRLSLSTTTTVYLLAYSGFSGGTSAAYGWITARRAR